MASLERSLQNCSLTHHRRRSIAGTATGGDSPAMSSAEEATLELNSEAALPFYWEQCLDLKTGELYFINWRTGIKAKEDPRIGYHYYSSSSSEDDSSCSYDSERGSSSESSPPCSSSSRLFPSVPAVISEIGAGGNVLVVAGCKRCLMYYMVPKRIAVCPKCRGGELLHFDQVDNC
ncbi:hypothetical protein M569_15500 [Genlisea aurea]|uniref:GIR1-like zinc ribbon domain-containing protein n=1 Tax=Genlisea aurea TaxID=192259 RepID=S8BY15_9LAMI|nr:hypothetical protein M569_15500 [Genlisea aurea]